MNAIFSVLPDGHNRTIQRAISPLLPSPPLPMEWNYQHTKISTMPYPCDMDSLHHQTTFQLAVMGLICFTLLHHALCCKKGGFVISCHNEI
jgi:hypothetical protein